MLLYNQTNPAKLLWSKAAEIKIKEILVKIISIVLKFKLWLRYYIHFQTYTLEKGIKSHIPLPVMDKKCTSNCPTRKSLALNDT